MWDQTLQTYIYRENIYENDTYTVMTSEISEQKVIFCIKFKRFQDKPQICIPFYKRSTSIIPLFHIT